MKLSKNVKETREEIARIIEVNMPLMKKNKQMIQEVTDAIIVYLMLKEEE